MEGDEKAAIADFLITLHLE